MLHDLVRRRGPPRRQLFGRPQAGWWRPPARAAVLASVCSVVFSVVAQRVLQSGAVSQPQVASSAVAAALRELWQVQTLSPQRAAARTAVGGSHHAHRGLWHCGATFHLVGEALKAGYQKLDTAQAREWYREDLVGAALAASGAPRSSIFLTTKVHPRSFGVNATRAAVAQSLRDLQTPWLDLVLLHYAECWGDLCGGAKPEGTWREAWAVLEQLVDEQVVRAIGVSNFDVKQLSELVAAARIQPSLLQLNSEPLRPNAAAQALCRRLGIQFEGYSTLGGQYLVVPLSGNPVVENPVVGAIAAAKGVTAAQVVLRWALQNGQTVVPRTSRPARMRENLAVLTVAPLADDELDSLAALAASP